MITVKNLQDKYPDIDQSLLPDVLKKNEYESVLTMLEFYGEDSDITETVDLFVSSLNNYIGSDSPKKKVKSKVRKIVVRKTTKQRDKKKTEESNSAKRKKARENKKNSKLNVRNLRKSMAKKIKQPKVEKIDKTKRNELNNVPNWLSTLRKFVTMANKEYSQTTLRNYLSFIQKNFDSKRPGANSTTHIEYIRVIQDLIVKSINSNIGEKKVKFSAPGSLVDKIKAVNKSYVAKIDRKSKVSRIGLKGTQSISGLSGLGIITSTDLAKQEFKTLDFTGKFKDLIGNPTKPFQIMIYGLPGSGKSTLAIQFAKYLATNHGLKVLYVAREEGISGTTQEKFIRLDAIHANIHISEKIPSDLSNYDVVFIDSVNEMNLTPDNLRQIVKQYPNLSTVQLFKATKEGKFLGQSDFAHLCQAEIRCFENKAQAQKNRFGGNTEVSIL